MRASISSHRSDSGSNPDPLIRSQAHWRCSSNKSFKWYFHGMTPSTAIYILLLLFDTGLEHNLKYGREMRDDWIICSKSISASKKRDICHELSTCYVCLLSRRAIYVNIFGALLIQGYWTIYRQLYRDRRTDKNKFFSSKKKEIHRQKKNKAVRSVWESVLEQKKSKKREVIMRLVSSQFWITWSFLWQICRTYVKT